MSFVAALCRSLGPGSSYVWQLLCKLFDAGMRRFLSRLGRDMDAGETMGLSNTCTASFFGGGGGMKGTYLGRYILQLCLPFNTRISRQYQTLQQPPFPKPIRSFPLPPCLFLPILLTHFPSDLNTNQTSSMTPPNRYILTAIPFICPPHHGERSGFPSPSTLCTCSV